MKNILFIIILFILIIIAFSYSHCEEEFSNPYLILTTQPSNSIYSNVKFIKQKKLDYIIESLSIRDVKSKNTNTKISILIDPLDYYKKLRKKYDFVKSYKGHFIYFSTIRLANNCTYNFEYKTIGYLTKTDYLFIKSIIKGHRMFEHTIKLKQLNPTVPNFNNVDFVVTRIVRNSKLYDQISNLSLYVYGFKDMDINRIKLFYPFVESYDTDLASFFNYSKVLKFEKGSTNIPSLSMNLIENIPNFNELENESEESENESEDDNRNDKRYYEKSNNDENIDIEKRINESFISRLKIKKDIYDERYNCYNDEQNINKALCNSKYDMVGNLKDYESLWDKRCMEDKDCPFYQKNKNYSNKKGGCIIKDKDIYGSCETPVGVTKIGYTKYKDKPFCYTKDGHCDNYMFPDYAFPNDKKERQKNKKEIIISM